MRDMPKIEVGKNFRLAVNKSSVSLRASILNLHLNAGLTLNPNIETVGVMSRTSGQELRHCLFLDFDSVVLQILRDEVRMLQSLEDVGTAVILASREEKNVHGEPYGNYHVMFLTKWTLKEAKDLMDLTSCDLRFRKVPYFFNYKSWVLRVAPKYYFKGGKLKVWADKPHLREVIYSPTKREINGPLYDFLIRYYGMDEWQGSCKPKFDRCKNLPLMHYQTTLGWTPIRLKLMRRKAEALLSKFKIGGGSNAKNNQQP